MFKDLFPYKRPYFKPLPEEELRFFVEFLKPCFVFEERVEEKRGKEIAAKTEVVA